jgi:LysR family hydrogen peroxide-inducible transcriptional activator
VTSRLPFSLTQLEYVLAVHKYGSISEAAKRSLVTQPTLSMQLQKLEEDLGAVIFDRSKKPILLTSQGEKLIEQMRSILFEAKKIHSILDATKGEALSGTLTVGIIPTVAPYLLPRLLPVMEKSYPEIRLTILELQTHRMIESLNNDEIDLGVLALPLEIPKIHERALYWEPFSVLCQKSHAMAKLKTIKYSGLKPEGIWLLEEGHCLRNQMLDVCSIRPKGADQRKFKFESGSLETLKSLVSSYGGYTLLPALAAESIAPNVKLVHFDRPIPAREIGTISRREHYKTELQIAFETAVVSSIPQQLVKTKKKDLEVIPIA